MVQDAIEVVPYDPAWPEQFLHESQRLRQALGHLCLAIEHIGSTAVPNLVAKPVIDMMGAVSSLTLLDRAIQQVIELGYETVPVLDAVLVYHRFALRRGEDGRRAFHFHLHVLDSEEWTRQLRWRDRLRQAPQLAVEYGALKQELALRYAQDRQGYMDEKHVFIEAIEPHTEISRQLRQKLRLAQAPRQAPVPSHEVSKEEPK
jgi:GrpB-like predicted nucleotidyltransferase (UPF0157 family)